MSKYHDYFVNSIKVDLSKYEKKEQQNKGKEHAKQLKRKKP